AARVDPDLFSGDARGGKFALDALRRIAPGGFPDVPGVIVVGNAAGGHGEIEDAGREIVGGERENARGGGAASGRRARRYWPRTPSRLRGERRAGHGGDRSGWRRS